MRPLSLHGFIGEFHLFIAPNIINLATTVAGFVVRKTDVPVSSAVINKTQAQDLIKQTVDRFS